MVINQDPTNVIMVVLDTSTGAVRDANHPNRFLDASGPLNGVDIPVAMVGYYPGTSGYQHSPE